MDDGSEPASPFETYADPSGAPGSSTADRAPRRAARTDNLLLRPSAAASALVSASTSMVALNTAADGGGEGREARAVEGGEGGRGGGEATGAEAAEVKEEEEDDESTMHRLCPTYAQDINSPLRHVRTRIYFTSESHVHSLVNVLRFAHLKYGFEQEEKEKRQREAKERAAEAAAAAAAAASEQQRSTAPPPPSPTPPLQMPFSSHPPLLSPEAIGASF